MLDDLLIRLLVRLSFGKPRVITGRGEDGEHTVYLTRYFLTPWSARTEGMDDAGPPPRWGLYLHRFHRGDNDLALHNHPWRWAVSLVLKAGYSEERRTDGGNSCGPDLNGYPFSRVIRRTVRPWTLNFITHRDFHRVDLFTDGCFDDCYNPADGPRREAWTLFLVGPVVQSWGFWDRDSKVFTPWKKYLGIEP